MTQFDIKRSHIFFREEDKIMFIAADSDPEWEKRREKSGGNTFGMVDSAVKEYLNKPEKIKD